MRGLLKNFFLLIAETVFKIKTVLRVERVKKKTFIILLIGLFFFLVWSLKNAFTFEIQSRDGLKMRIKLLLFMRLGLEKMQKLLWKARFQVSITKSRILLFSFKIHEKFHIVEPINWRIWVAQFRSWIHNICWMLQFFYRDLVDIYHNFPITSKSYLDHLI